MPLTPVANANNLIRFRKEDYKESPSWFDRVIYALNVLVDYTSTIGGSLGSLSTSVSNLAEIKFFEFLMTSSGTSTTNPETNTFTFQNPSIRPVKQLLIYATNNTIPIFTSPVWASWHVANGVVFIDAITGLSNSTQYTFTVTLIGG